MDHRKAAHFASPTRLGGWGMMMLARQLGEALGGLQNDPRRETHGSNRLQELSSAPPLGWPSEQKESEQKPSKAKKATFRLCLDSKVLVLC